MQCGSLLALRAAPWRGLRSALLALAGALLVGAPPAGAVSTFFDQDLGTGVVPGTHANSSLTQTQFLAAIGPSQTEDFELFAVADHGPLAIFGGGAVTGTLSDTVSDSGSIRNFSDANRGFATSDDQFWKNTTTSLTSDDLFRVDFSQQVRAFGFFATAWATESSPTNDATALVLYLLRNGMAPEAVSIPHDQNDNPGGVFYFGVLADLPFDGVALRNDSTTDPGDRIGFDDFTVAVVPEPATALLLLGGLLGLAAIGRRSVGPRRRG